MFEAQEEDRKSCRDLICGANAACDYRGEEPYCYCKTGFRGDGYSCEPIGKCCYCKTGFRRDEYSCEAIGKWCYCKTGFREDGYTCEPM